MTLLQSIYKNCYIPMGLGVAYAQQTRVICNRTKLGQ